MSESVASINILAVWCHVCEGNRTAHLNTTTCEYNCDECFSECVEEIDQGAELFVPAPMNEEPRSTEQSEEDSSSESNTDNNEAESNAIVQQLMGRLFNSGGSDGGTRVQALPNGRGVVMTTTMSVPVNAFTAGYLTRSQSQQAAGSSNSGIYGLLSSLDSIQSQAAGYRSGFGSFGGANRDAIEAAESSALAQIMHNILMHESSRMGAPPAADDVIERLPSEVIGADADRESLGVCNISQETFEPGDTVVTLPCDHKYHKDNIVHWLEMHNTCPVCRIEVK